MKIAHRHLNFRVAHQCGKRRQIHARLRCTSPVGVPQIIQAEMIGDTRAPDSGVVSLSDRTDRLIGTARRAENKPPRISVHSSSEYLVYSLSHRNRPLRSFGLSVRIKDGSPLEANICGLHPKDFLRAHSCFENNLGNILERLARVPEVRPFFVPGDDSHTPSSFIEKADTESGIASRKVASQSMIEDQLQRGERPVDGYG